MAVLAEITGRGNIKRCTGQGCIHLTYRTTSLHFRSAEDFASLVRIWSECLNQENLREEAAENPRDWMVQLDYGRASLRLFGDEAVEMEWMLQKAMQHLTPFLPPNNETEWPEGDVYVPLPDFSQIPFHVQDWQIEESRK
jgi:hypothetical protein